MNYESALEQLKKRDSRKLMNNTYLEHHEDTCKVKLHNTYVLTFNENGTTEYNSGGYKTVTTKHRMNEYGPIGWRVWQQNSEWFLSLGQYNEGYIFFDGIQVKEHEVLNAITYNKDKAKQEKKAINKYVKGFMQRLTEKTMPPNLSDCLLCQFSKDQSLNQPERESIDHIRSHVDEHYYVAALLHKACTLYPIGAMAWHYMLERDKTIAWASFYHGQITNSLKRFMYRAYGYAS